MRLFWYLLFGLATGAAAVLWWLPPPGDDALESRWMANVRVIAGDGVAGVRDGDSGRARFADPFGVAVRPDGTIYVADGAGSHRIRAISPDGTVTTIAGGARGFADGLGVSARFDTPSALAIDTTGALLVADTGNNAIRRVTPDGQVSTLAGEGTAGFRDGPAREAQFNGPIGLAVDAAGRVIVADAYNDRIRIVDVNGDVTTLAGGDPGSVDGAGVDARFETPSGVAVDVSGTIFVADTGNHLIRTISPAGEVSTLRSIPADGLVEPVGITTDAAGTVYVSDDRGRIIELARGSARVVAGSTPGFADGTGAEARFRRPSGIAAAAPGRLIVADAGNALVRMVAAASRMAALPPASPLITPRFDPEAFAWQPMLWPLDPLEGPFEIAGTLGEARGAGAERFHAGIDVRADQGTRVVALREGTVLSPVATGGFGTLNEWMRIGPIGYVHLRVGRDGSGMVYDRSRFVATRDDQGRIVRMRVRRGARFLTGERIGTVNAFNHVHVNVGWPGEEYNPLRFRLVQFKDTVPPTIARGGVRLYSADGQPLTRRAKGRVLLSGPVQVVVDAWDQVDGNRPNRRLGLYSLGYQILQQDGTPAPGFATPRETIRFDQLRAEEDAAPLVYASGSGIPFYGGRRTRFLYVVTNTFRDGVAAPGFWDTGELPPGDYTLRVLAMDANGNEAMRNRDVAVTVLAPEPSSPTSPDA